MAANLAAFRALVRIDLHDEDAAAYRWTDATLDRHILRAVAEYSLHVPDEQKGGFALTPGSRNITVSGLTPRIAIEAVEYPVGEFPPRFVGYSEWDNVLTMDVTNAPGSGETANVYWTKAHVVDGAGSTVPSHHDLVICAGAAGYAALDWTSFSSNRVNTGGEDVWGRYKAFADERLRAFVAELARLSRRNRVIGRRMFTTDAPSIFEQSRVKY